MQFHGVQLEKDGCCGWTAFRVERTIWLSRVDATQFRNLVVTHTVWLHLGWPLVSWGTEVLDLYED